VLCGPYSTSVLQRGQDRNAVLELVAAPTFHILVRELRRAQGPELVQELWLVRESGPGIYPFICEHDYLYDLVILAYLGISARHAKNQVRIFTLLARDHATGCRDFPDIRDHGTSLTSII
jgi:hypothetical protein